MAGPRKGLGDRANRHDPAYLRAKKEKYAGRAIYKLEEIDKKFKLLRRGAKVLDLGCWPGSWIQYALQRTGDDTTMVGIDLKPVELALPSHVQTIVGDVYKLKTDALLRRFGTFDVVLSDMAPNTTGNKDSDVHGSEELAFRALEIAEAVSRTGAHFAAKVFQGARFGELQAALRERYQFEHTYHAKNTRRGSREMYLVGQGLKGRYGRPAQDPAP